MIRQPSPASALYAWHRAMMAGERPAVHEGLPEAGWFKVREGEGDIHRLKPWVPVCISVQREVDEAGELTGPEVLVADCNGKQLSPEQTARLWVWLKPISRAEYDALVYAAAFPPEEPEPKAAPVRKPKPQIDLTRMPQAWT
jgi:hypothetical protein